MNVTSDHAVPDISVIVATRDRSPGCRRLVEALHTQFASSTITFEIVLVFDGCPVYTWVPGTTALTVVENPAQQGIARSRNTGIGMARGRLLAFLDDDCVPADSWLSSLLRLDQTYPAAIAFGGKVLGTDQVNLFSQLRDAVYYWETFGSWYTDPLSAGDQPGAPYVNGGNSVYRREAVTAAGGFDPLLPAYSDVELGRRLNLRQGAVLTAGLDIHHDHPSDFRQYMLRCKRSGQARALLWRHRGYQQDSPARVLATIITNVARTNFIRRRRVQAPAIGVLAVLFCQEAMHGFGYLYTLTRRWRRTSAGRWSADQARGANPQGQANVDLDRGTPTPPGL